MMLHVPALLSKAQVQHIRERMQQEKQWISGTKTAGHQAQKIKNNLQLNTESELYINLNQFVTQTIKNNLLVQSFALARDILPPMFNCYQDGGTYGNHVDNAFQWSRLQQKNIRTDVSMTIFLSEPDEYEGGELIVEDSYGSHEVKLDAGDAILYPATSLHRVEPVTRGARIASFTWIQSIVKDDWQRSMLFNLDMTIIQLRQKIGDCEETLALTNHYHNLLRQWGEV
ncbi:Fe2+-dependent dioxygenase [Acinetobacter qingfengensis]|uniref:Fe2+-dependent dioxygenase n=1 Tax=Acinetobacter qingfengensis TaxID=1262585 RepID=A0A1E7R152_9GAMM|nr:Fe2+-dependent dioxygenase [Acinetobacter qingfengensis]KAA8733323.1 Fe2+-dependent dioxygenase [Acinetobacter qingfengensis]OEY93050.1 Fe2+-dependent dioxygenase [Acinetobacter qingfengensis]